VKNGNLPVLAKGWHWRKLGDCARLINGRAYAQDELLDAGTPVLRIQNLNGGDRWYYSSLELPDDKYCEAGDLLYAWSASFGPYRFAGLKSIFHYHIWRVVVGDELDKGFAFRLLGWITAAVKSAAHGVAMLHMTKAGMEAWQIPLPPLAEQRRIAEVLDRAEALRAKRRAALAQLDDLTQAIFLDLFGDPVTNPKGWPETKSLGDVADMVSGITKGRALPTKATREVPYLAVSNVQDRALSMSVVKKIAATEDEISRYRLMPDDLLLTEGGDPDKLGRGTLWNSELPECIHQNHIFRVRLTTDEVNPLFLNWLVGSQRGKRYFLRSAKQTTGIASINMTQLRGFPLLLPPLALQHDFARRIAAVEKLKTAHRASLAEMDALFAALQHRAFRGEL
jgi:type I restriction enzyme S subunit